LQVEKMCSTTLKKFPVPMMSGDLHELNNTPILNDDGGHKKYQMLIGMLKIGL
jgi:hypothetical protein